MKFAGVISVTEPSSISNAIPLNVLFCNPSVKVVPTATKDPVYVTAEPVGVIAVHASALELPTLPILIVVSAPIVLFNSTE